MSAEPLKDNENVPTITLRIRTGPCERGVEGGGASEEEEEGEKKKIMTNAFGN